MKLFVPFVPWMPGLRQRFIVVIISIVLQWMIRPTSLLQLFCGCEMSVGALH